MYARGKLHKSAMDAQRFDPRSRRRPASAEIPCVEFDETIQGRANKHLTRSSSAPELQRSNYPSHGNSGYLVKGTFKTNDATHYMDVFEHADGSTTTRTIIAPHPTRKLNFSCISDPSAEGNVTPKTQGSGLNCCKTDGIENEEYVVQSAIKDHKKHLSERGLMVSKYVERETSTEEKWRNPVESILYERSGRAVDSVTSRVEVNGPEWRTMRRF